MIPAGVTVEAFIVAAGPELAGEEFAYTAGYPALDHPRRSHEDTLAALISWGCTYLEAVDVLNRAQEATLHELWRLSTVDDYTIGQEVEVYGHGRWRSGAIEKIGRRFVLVRYHAGGRPQLKRIDPAAYRERPVPGELRSAVRPILRPTEAEA